MDVEERVAGLPAPERKRWKASFEVPLVRGPEPRDGEWEEYLLTMEVHATPADAGLAPRERILTRVVAPGHRVHVDLELTGDRLVFVQEAPGRAPRAVRTLSMRQLCDAVAEEDSA